jgi:hypothetical protein
VIYIRNVPRRMGRSGLHDQKIIWILILETSAGLSWLF